jgi:SAM-dependent methyltransferase
MAARRTPRDLKWFLSLPGKVVRRVATLGRPVDPGDLGHTPGSETSNILELCGDDLRKYLTGEGIDFGCEVDPVPGATVLVDGQQAIAHRFGATHEVHIRDVNEPFDDWFAAGRQFDFVYSSHLLEHVLNPHAFLSTCCRLLKPGGHLILVLPDEDMYWPRSHPWANPDHRWWDLNPTKVTRWTRAAFGRQDLAPVFEHAATAPGSPMWSFVLVFKKPL